MAAIQTKKSPVDDSVEKWKIKKLINTLEMSKGNGKSLITLIIPPKDNISVVCTMLAGQLKSAGHIKHKITRADVIEAIKSVQQTLKSYAKVPPNGLVIYCGILVTDVERPKLFSVDFEPFEAVNTFIYLVSKKFNLDALTGLLACDKKFGFIIVDGKGSIFCTLQRNTREILEKLTENLPNKHRCGGQSSSRFARLRLEKRHQHVQKVIERANELFITEGQPNVAGLIIAGTAEIKNELCETRIFDRRLRSKIVKVVTVSHGHEDGLDEAIDIAAKSLQCVELIQEKKRIGFFLEQIANDTGKICFGLRDTFIALKLGVVETLICAENLEVHHYILKNPATKEEKYDSQLKGFTDVALGIFECQNIVQWLIENHKKFGTNLKIVSDTSQEAQRFATEFGGIGGLLRYNVDFQSIETD